MATKVKEVPAAVWTQEDEAALQGMLSRREEVTTENRAKVRAVWAQSQFGHRVCEEATDFIIEHAQEFIAGLTPFVQ